MDKLPLKRNTVGTHDRTKTLMTRQVTIRLTFVLSAIALAWIDRLTFRGADSEQH